MDTKNKIIAAVLLANGIGLVLCGATYLYKMAYIHGQIDGATTYFSHLRELMKCEKEETEAETK